MGMSFVFFNDTATTEIYTLSLHDALPILTIVGPTEDSTRLNSVCPSSWAQTVMAAMSTQSRAAKPTSGSRSEEHTSELQSRQYLVCRLLLEKKKTNKDSQALHN